MGNPFLPPDVNAVVGKDGKFKGAIVEHAAASRRALYQEAKRQGHGNIQNEASYSRSSAVARPIHPGASSLGPRSQVRRALRDSAVRLHEAWSSESESR